MPFGPASADLFKDIGSAINDGFQNPNRDAFERVEVICLFVSAGAKILNGLVSISVPRRGIHRGGNDRLTHQIDII
jgi:hypothetical protein